MKTPRTVSTFSMLGIAPGRHLILPFRELTINNFILINILITTNSSSSYINSSAKGCSSVCTG